jgi:hypothetical protein
MQEWLVSYSEVWININRPKNANYDSFKKILTILRKKVFCYLSIYLLSRLKESKPGRRRF